MQYLPVGVSALVIPCHMSALLWKELSLSGLDQHFIVCQQAMILYCSTVALIVMEHVTMEL